MMRAVLACAAASAMPGCKPDAVWSFDESHGSISVTIAAEQSDLCHPDCSTEASQTSHQMFFVIGARGDGGLPESPLEPGVYQAPPPRDGGPGILQWEVGGVCDNAGSWPKFPSGTVTLTHVAWGPNDRLEGSYQIDPSGGPYFFTEGTFSARICP